MKSKRPSRKPTARKKAVPVLETHENRVYEISGSLLEAFRLHMQPRMSENIKGVGFFLTCLGDALESGSLKEARKLRLTLGANASVDNQKLGVALVLLGDNIMDWSVGLLKREKEKEKEKSHEPSRAKD